MDTKHTPGPWMVETTEMWLWVGTPKADNIKVSEVVVALDYGKGYKSGFYQRQEANARLIAAAPELLEALIEMVRLAGDGKRFDDSLLSDEGQALFAAKAIIAKATQP